MLNKLKDLFKKISKSTIIDEKELKEYIRDFQRILIASDVDVKLVFKISKEIEEEFKKVKELKGISPKEKLIEIIYDKLVEILGEENTELLNKGTIMLIGMYGQGKTTTAGKLAKFYSKRGRKVCLVSLDKYRPGAYDQLKQISEKINVPCFKDVENLENLKEYDIKILDTAGRDSLNQELLEELKSIYEKYNPDHVYLVFSADVGKTIKKQVEEFKKYVPINGIILTRMDSSAKGGGALTSCYLSGANVKFIGTGEKLDDLKPFNPKKYIGKILGIPDLESLLDKIKEVSKKVDIEKYLDGDLTLDMFYDQIEMIKEFGSMEELAGMLGLELDKKNAYEIERKLNRMKYILDSMRKCERKEPKKITSKRIKEIAYGSGTSEEEVRELLKRYWASKKLVQKFKKGKFAKLLKKFDLSKLSNLGGLFGR